MRSYFFQYFTAYLFTNKNASIFYSSVICITVSFIPKEFIMSLKKGYTYAQTHAHSLLMNV